MQRPGAPFPFLFRGQQQPSRAGGASRSTAATTTTKKQQAPVPLALLPLIVRLNSSSREEPAGEADLATVGFKQEDDEGWASSGSWQQQEGVKNEEEEGTVGIMNDDDDNEKEEERGGEERPHKRARGCGMVVDDEGDERAGGIEKRE